MVSADWRWAFCARLAAAGWQPNKTIMAWPNASAYPGSRSMTEPSSWLRPLYSAFRKSAERPIDSRSLVRLGVDVRISQWALRLMRDRKISGAFLECARTREASMFRFIFHGVYVCDAIEPSLHRGSKYWSVGGRGGVPSGIYWLGPYRWKDRQMLPVWELRGDPSRGAILLHSGNTVADSRGCFLMGLNKRGMTVSDSYLTTSVVWALLDWLIPPVHEFDARAAILVLRNDRAFDNP